SNRTARGRRHRSRRRSVLSSAHEETGTLMKTSFLTVRNLKFRYDREDVLKDLSFDIHAGEILAILGPNASGKTTLLKNIAGLLHPTSVQILIDGSSLSSRPHKERARIIAFVPQTEDTFLDFSVEQTVLMGRAPYVGVWGFENAKDRAKACEAMERTDTWR